MAYPKYRICERYDGSISIDVKLAFFSGWDYFGMKDSIEDARETIQWLINDKKRSDELRMQRKKNNMIKRIVEVSE